MPIYVVMYGNWIHDVLTGHVERVFRTPDAAKRYIRSQGATWDPKHTHWASSNESGDVVYWVEPSTLEP